MTVVVSGAGAGMDGSNETPEPRSVPLTTAEQADLDTWWAFIAKDEQWRRPKSSSPAK